MSQNKKISYSVSHNTVQARMPDGSVWEFFWSGYIYCDRGAARNHGTCGDQICRGGAFRGCTLSTKENEGFAYLVKKWVRDFRKNEPHLEIWRS